MSSSSPIDQTPLKRALPRAGLGLSLLAAVALLPGAWGTAFGQTVPPVGHKDERPVDPLTLPPGPPIVARFAHPADEPAGETPMHLTATLTTPEGVTVGTVSLSAAVVDNTPAPVEVSLNAAPPIDPTSLLLGGLTAGGPTAPLPVTPRIEIRGTVLELRLDTVDPATGQGVPLAPEVANAPVTLRLPALPMARHAEPVYLVELRDENGESLGFMRVVATFDSATDSLRFELPAGMLASNPRIVPATIDPSPITVDPGALVFSGPTQDAIAFGEAGASNFEVIGPPVAGRLPVRDAMTGGLGWIDAPAAPLA